MNTEATVGESAAPPSRDQTIRLIIDLRVYRLTAIQKTAYRLADKCTAAFGALAEESVPVTLVFPPNVGEREARSVERLFFQELLDQELREKIGAETQALRSLIVAQAFSRTDLISRD
jgi:His-Xaa-Ser system protein HxsD